MRYAVIENNFVVNVVEALSIPADKFGGSAAVSSELANIGDLWDGSVFIPFASPVDTSNNVFGVDEVSPFQAKAALHEVGLLDDVETIMANPSTPKITRIAWSDAVSFKRDSEMVIGMAQLLGLSDSQLDALFQRASEIN